jgi:protein TonB
MDDAPPADLLGLDAEGTAGGDGFGLLARRGGRDFLAGAGGSVYTWYAGRVKNEILDQLAADERVRSRRYSVLVRIWVYPDGRIDRVVLADSTGSAEVDGVLQAALNEIRRMSDQPPPDMPQPIQIRIVSRS